ncbi:MAG: BACON domain-containing protein, partial [Blastocatellia bacterium]
GNGIYSIEVTSSLPDITGNYSLELSLGAATCTFLISPNSQTFGASGGSSSITVTTGVSCNWTAISNDLSFINITSGASGSGVATVNYTVSVNPGAARTGTMTIAGQTFTVSQGAGPGCTYSISPTSQTFTSSGGGSTVTVSAPAGCPWTAVSNDAFIIVTAGASGNGNGTVSYSVAANSTGATRAGTIIVAGRTFTVVQGTNGSGITILLLSPLPKVTQPVDIDATTQPGYSGFPSVEINGASVGGGNGLEITAGNSSVRGLTLNRFASNNRVSAVVLITNGNNIIENCYIGANAVGTGAFAPFGAGPIAAGIAIRSSSNNRIGGTVSAARNLISGVDGSGIVISGGATGNLVEGNYIGTDATGNISLGNQRVGVYIQGASGNTVGGTGGGSGNLISGNLEYGVFLQDDAQNNLVQGNIIGANGAGTNTAPNGNAGIFVYDPSGAATAILNNTLGGTTPTARNTISGNDPYGVVLGVGATGTLVQGNFIGTDATGNAPLPNTYGVTVTQATGSTVGGAIAGARNIISGNRLTGIIIGFLNNGQTGGTGTTIQGNFMGTNSAGTGALGNGQDGIFVEVNSVTHIIKENVIAFNGASGLRIPNLTDNPGAPGFRIDTRSNSIFSNVAGGIDLGPAGATKNDPRDPDVGANVLQNYPTMISVTFMNGMLHIIGSFNSTPNSNFWLDFYTSDQCTESNPQVGQRVIALGLL